MQHIAKLLGESSCNRHLSAAGVCRAVRPQDRVRRRLDRPVPGTQVRLEDDQREPQRGLSYRSAIEYTVEGDISFDLPTVPVTSVATGAIAQVLAGAVQPGQRLSSGPVRASIKMPDSFSLSAASEVNSQLQLLADVSWTGWSNIPKLEFARTWSPASGRGPCNIASPDFIGADQLLEALPDCARTRRAA